MDFENIIAKMIVDTLDGSDITVADVKNNIEVPKDETNGDYSFPCFKLSKTLKKSPIQIADDIKEKINIDGSFIDSIDNVKGFLNFYISKKEIVASIVDKFNSQKEKYGESNLGEGKTVITEYSSPNIAKPFHIGHLKTTIIGQCLCNIYKKLGFNVISDNHLGDYGTQFAKLIVAYDKWGDEYDFSENPIDKLAELYVRINQLCEDDEEVLELCRDTFKKLEDGDEHCVEIWNKFKELSLIEFNEIYDLLGVKFDTMYGEAFYASHIMPEVLDILEKSGALIESEGAKIIDLSHEGIDTPFMVQKANGSSIYATRDLATILFRVREYDYYKNIYVVGKEQSLYFKQLFLAARHMGIDQKYIDGCEHVSYGLIRLPEGKMSSRKGNFIKVKDLLIEAIDKVKEIVKDRDIENKEEVAKQIGIGAIKFDYLKDTTVKDQVFDVNEALNFTGETGPYVQYTTVRTNSVLEKAGYIPEYENIYLEKLIDDASLSVLKTIAEYPEVIKFAMEKSEPSYVARYLLKLAKKYSNFYNNNKIICDDKELQDARLYLTYMTNITLKNGLALLGMEVPEKM